MITTLRFQIPLLLAMLVLLAGCRTMDDEISESMKMTPAEFAIADGDSDGKLTKQELASHKHKEALAEFDLDSDGKISAGEWATARPSSGEDDPHFNSLDKDGDGHVGQEEAVQFITQHVSFGDRFSDLDKNGDFSLHWEEIDAGAPDSLNVTLFSIHPDS